MNNVQSNNRQSFEFQELKPKFWQALYSIYRAHASGDKTLEDRVAILKGAIIPFGFTDEMSTQIAAAFINLFDSLQNGAITEGSGMSSTTPTYIDSSNQLEAHLSVLDIKELKAFAEQDPDNRAAIKLLVAFAIYARANPHPSHRIKYDRATIFFLANLQEIKTSEQERLTKYLHEYYNLNMQVVGSNTPIPCFKLKWMAEQPSPLEPDSSNPLVYVGNYSPVTIDHLMQTTFAASNTLTRAEATATSINKEK